MQTATVAPRLGGLAAPTPPPAQGPTGEIVVVWPDDLTHQTRWRLLYAACMALVYDTPAALVIDLHQCQYLSEEGVSALLVIHRRAEAAGTTLRVQVAGQPARKLRTMGLHALFLVDPVPTG